MTSPPRDGADAGSSCRHASARSTRAADPGVGVRDFIARAAGLAAAILLLRPDPAAAQLALSGDVTLATRSMWRGTTRALGPVAHIGAHLTFTGAPVFVSAGVWSGLELHRAAPGEPTAVGSGRRGIGELDAWAAVSGRSGIVDWTGGVNHRRVDRLPPAHAGRFATTEVWVAATGSAWPLIPRLAAWLDLDEVRGRYYELGLTYPAPVDPLGTPLASIDLTADAGINDGQSLDPSASDASGYFARNGLTHIDLSGAVTLDLATLLPGSLHGAVHYQIARDANTTMRRVPDAGEQRNGWWAELGISLTTLNAR